MPRALKLFAVLILMAVLPLRAVAGVTIGFCASGHMDMAAAHATGHADGGEAHVPHDDAPPAKPASCNICAEHCSSAAFAIPAVPVTEAQPAGRDRTAFAALVSPFHIPDQLDRPPLA